MTKKHAIDPVSEGAGELEGFFKPRSITVIGASRKEGSLGRVFLDKLIHCGYRGKIYPVNPQAGEIEGISCFPTIESLPEIPEMAVILVRKDLALSAVEGCGQKGIKNIVMITAGFREVGGEGIKREKELMKTIGKYDMRLIGPNCMGVINTDPEIKMNASFSPTEPYCGNVAFVSQSGALGVAVLEMSRGIQLGISIFVSEGNKADLIDSDFLEYLATHSRTRVITLYLESIEDPSRFRKIAAQIGKHKPVIALKAGSSTSGARAASSHTGALASSQRATDALFRQCGIIQAETVQEMFNFALAFSNQPPPGGNRIVIMTNAGGPGILATDAVEKYGLRMAALNESTRLALQSFLPEEASVHNPVDMIASANQETYRKTLDLLLKDPAADAILVIIVRPPVDTTPKMIAEEFRGILNKKSSKPIFISLMAERNEQSGLSVFQELNLPVYSYPETAIQSMATMLRYEQWRKKPAGKIHRYPVQRGNLQHIFEAARVENRAQLRTSEILTLLGAYELPVARGKMAQSASEAVQIAAEFDTPVVLKIEADQIIHKSDAGGVKINLRHPDEIQAAFQQIMDNALSVTPPDQISGIFVQEMVRGSHEIALGMNRDPNYGPMIMFGMGGIFIEVFNDVSFRIAPLTDNDAREMITEIRGYPLLTGLRGQPPVNTDLLVESLQKLSRLALDWPELAEVDFNPFMVAPEVKNCKIVDVRMRLSW